MISDDIGNDYFLVVYEENETFKLTSLLAKEGYKSNGGPPLFFPEEPLPFCNWMFIHIVKKTFYRGAPGVRYAYVIGEHAITVDEFFVIFEIYKKYEGLKLREFRQDLDIKL